MPCLIGRPDSWLSFSTPSIVSCCHKTSQKGGGKGGKKRSYLIFSLLPLIHWTGISPHRCLVPNSISWWHALPVTQPGGGTARRLWWAQLLSLEENFPVVTGRSGIIVCWIFNFVSEVRSREESYGAYMAHHCPRQPTVLRKPMNGLIHEWEETGQAKYYKASNSSQNNLGI